MCNWSPKTREEKGAEEILEDNNCWEYSKDIKRLNEPQAGLIQKKPHIVISSSNAGNQRQTSQKQKIVCKIVALRLIKDFLSETMKLK